MKPILLCLHGWGGTKDSFTELREALKGANLDILTPDLPGFGDEPEPDRPWTTDDYADWVEHWLEEKLSKVKGQRSAVHICAHSHGGRIALKLAARQCHPEPVKGPPMIHASSLRPPQADYGRQACFMIQHLYLCASAGIHRPRHIKRILGLSLSKSGKFFLSIPGLSKLQPLGRTLLYRLVRVHDYEKASPTMRQTLMMITREDLRPLLGSITIPTDIFWGEDDRMTPVADARVFHDNIKGSQLHLFPGVAHRVHRDRAEEIAEIIRDHIYEK